MKGDEGNGDYFGWWDWERGDGGYGRCCDGMGGGGGESGEKEKRKERAEWGMKKRACG